MSSEAERLDMIFSELSTLSRRLGDLNSEISALRDARPSGVKPQGENILLLAQEIFGNRSILFLITPNAEFQGETPISLAQTAEGARRVEALLGRIASGVYC